MNINPLFPVQAGLDKRIVEEHNLQGQDLLEKKKVALLTELYECVNEARFFKFWSQKKANVIDVRLKDEYKSRKVIQGFTDAGIRRLFIDNKEIPFQDLNDYYCLVNPLLEEYVDTIHFALSIGIELGYTEHEYTGTEEMDLNGLVLGLTNIITILSRDMVTPTKTIMSILFDHVIKLGYQLGFTEKQVIEAYYEKNKINHERQNAGY